MVMIQQIKQTNERLLTMLCRAYAAVSAEVVEPWPDRPTEGFFNFSVEFSPMANPTWEAGR